MADTRPLRTRVDRETWLFWIVALLVLGAGLGLRDPWPADEPRFALVAKQMIESGNWLFPHRGIELYSDKPPMLMWLQAATYTVLRDWRVAFLLPSLLAALGTLWCVVDLGKRLWTRKVGLYAGWALLFALQFTYQAKKAQIDPLVTFWITLANYGLLRHFLCARQDRQPDWRMWTLGWFAAGLGTITKGVGVLALLMLVPALLASVRGWRGVRAPLRDLRVWLGPLAFAAAAAIWLLPMLVATLSSQDPAYRAYLHDILFRQTLDRYASSWSHPQPWWYFGPVLATWAPAILALPWAIPAWNRRLRRGDPRYLLPLAWCLLVIVFFSLAHGKRDVYILPALPMLCLALGPLLPGLLRKPWPRRIAWTAAIAVAVGTFVVGLWMLLGDPAFERHFLADRGLAPGSQGVAWMLVAIGIWAMAGLLWFGRRQPTAALLSALAGVWLMFGLVGYPLLNAASSARGLMDAVARRIGPDAQLGLVAWKEQNLLMSDRPTADFGFTVPWDEQLRSGAAWLAQDPGRRWLLVNADALLPCVDRARARRVGESNRREWWLVPAAAVVAPCVASGSAAQASPE